MPEPQPDTGNERIGAEEAQAPEARLNRGPAFVPLAQTPRASEFGVTPQSPADDEEADGEAAEAGPKPAKKGLLDRLRPRKKPRPAAADDADEDPAKEGSTGETDIDDEGEPDATPESPGRRLKLPFPSGRRARAAAAVGLSVAILGGALAYPKIFPGSAAKVEKGEGEEEGSEEAEKPAPSTASRESRQPPVTAIPSGRASSPGHSTAHAAPPTTEPELPDDPSMLPDPTTIVPTPKGEVRLASTDQPEPLDEPAPLPAGAGATGGDEPTPLPSDALNTGGQELARDKIEEPPSLELPVPTEIPPPLEAPAQQPAAVAKARPGENPAPPSLLDDPAPAPAAAPPSRPDNRFSAPPTIAANDPIPAPSPSASPDPPVDSGNFVEIPNLRKSRGSAVAAGTLAMASIDGGPSSRVRPLMDQPSSLEPAVTESVEPILHRVTSGQSFQTISTYYYATPRYWKALWAANRATVPAPEMLAVGMTIKIPMAEELNSGYVVPESPAAEPATIRSTPRNGVPDRVQQSRFDPANDPPRRNGKPTHTVRRNGETLRSIARDRLGDTSRAQEIYELNAERLDAMSPSLKAGTTLRLPDDARPEQP